MRISINRRISKRIILRMRLTCRSVKRCLRRMEGFILSIPYIKGGRNEC